MSKIFVLVNKHLPGFTVYDALTLSQVCQAVTEVAPHEVALSADARRAYIPIYGSSGVGQPGTDEHLFHIFDTGNGLRLGTIDTGRYMRLHSLVAGRSGMVYLTAETAAAVVLIDPKRREIVGYIETGSYTSHFIAADRAEKRLYCSNVQSKTVSVLDIQKRELIASVETDGENQRMTLSPDERWFVTSLGPRQQVAFYRTSDLALDFVVPVEGRPFTAKFSRDGRFVYDVGHKDGVVHAWKIDVGRREVVATAEQLGYNAGSLEVNPFDDTVYVSDQPSNRITILDPETWTPIRTLATAPSPDGMTFGEIVRG